ncbi:MAG: hypothetical protein QOF68_3231 [Gaiellales bacterium]|jgi:hypothetical protein|nr:hypothetical protein [Gaiellales bacterium]
MGRAFGTSVAAPQPYVVLSRPLPWSITLRPQAATAVALAPVAAAAPRLPVAPSWSLPRRRFTKDDVAFAVECATIFAGLLQLGWLPWEAFVLSMAAWCSHAAVDKAT